MRQGVKFHDGCDWNADAAVANFKQLTDKTDPAFDPLNYARARSRTNDIDHVEKIDDYTIAIDTIAVSSLFPYNTPYVLMLSPCALKAAGYDYQVYAKTPAGTGPYKFDRVVPHERLELREKRRLLGQEPRSRSRIASSCYPCPRHRPASRPCFQGRSIGSRRRRPTRSTALKSAGMQIVTNVYPHTWPYLLNVMHGPFKDVRVRQAANYAVNRGDMVEMLSGVAVPSYGIFVPSQRYYGHPFEFKTDTAKATALLKEANCYPCAITVAISTSGSGQMQPLPMNELVKEQLEKVGFKVKFDTLDWNTVLTIYLQGAVKYPQYDAVNFSSGATDPLNFIKTVMSTYRAPNGANWGGFADPKVDVLANQALATFDDAARTKLIAAMHELTVKDAVRLFIVSDLNPRALSPKLSGFVQAQSWFQDITPVVVK